MSQILTLSCADNLQPWVVLLIVLTCFRGCLASTHTVTLSLLYVKGYSLCN
uniref:Uncharacterized protein n=1 Tax=Anguilla anguilla TaxID=7936 RepID=A0A0E9W998_ANGAN